MRSWESLPGKPFLVTDLLAFKASITKEDRTSLQNTVFPALNEKMHMLVVSSNRQLLQLYEKWPVTLTGVRPRMLFVVDILVVGWELLSWCQASDIVATGT